SHAAVGKLAFRVLEPRLAKQDEMLREALVAADGMVQGGLVPAAQPLASSPHASRGSDPSGPTGSPGPFQKTLGAPPQRRAPIGAVLFGALGVASAVAAIVWTSLQAKPNALVTSPGGAQAPHGQATPASGPGAVGREGVSLDSIPLAEANQAADPRVLAPHNTPTTPRPTHVTLEEDVDPTAEKPAV